ncbi:MAG: hypothetical protein ACD_73C00600G0004 [uncultured bacterium]|nr:MAG: hypothetical protein ACD_73C00600G0004 [uncultured bacterium]
MQNLCEEFGGCFDIDPWFIHAYFEESGPVDLSDDASLNTLAQKVDQLILKISNKYREYGITESPYVYLKNDRGTYGMGLLPVFSGEEVLALNRKKKNKLLSSKGGMPVTEFILQEGIPTIDSYSGYPIEPVIYVVGGKDIGGFFRIHESKNELESLNAPGMTFSCLCLHKLDEPHEKFFIDCKEKEKLITMSRFLAGLDAIAASYETV